MEPAKDLDEIYERFKEWYRGKTATVVHRLCGLNGVTTTVGVQYHNTVVVLVRCSAITLLGEKYFPVELNTGGWETPTTKKRMNDASRLMGAKFYVVQKDFKWTVSGMPFRMYRATVVAPVKE
jgi:hypothetical protein